MMSNPATQRLSASETTVDTRLAQYISGAIERDLPAEVERKTRMHLLDTLVAIVSGRFLEPGAVAYRIGAAFGGPPEATLIGSDQRVGAVSAALANGMAAHADETDDSHARGRFHPGCAVVPAAIAVTEREGATGADLLRAIALGYDVGARSTIALGYDSPKSTRFSTHTIGGLFGAAAAAGALMRLSPAETEALLSVTTQQVSGLPYWNRDPDHIEKAFDFGGNGARSGVSAALMVRLGMTAPDQPLTAARGYLDAYAENPNPEALIDGLGESYEILAASLKKWTVGSPIQSVLDALEALTAANAFHWREVRDFHLQLPSNRVHVVDNRDIPSICVQHLAALMLVRGTVSFQDSHDDALMRDPDILALRGRIRVTPSDALAAALPERQSIVELELSDGRTLRHHAKAVRGTPDNPMTMDDLRKKSVEILEGTLAGGAQALCDTCLDGGDFAVAELLNACRTAD